MNIPLTNAKEKGLRQTLPKYGLNFDAVTAKEKGVMTKREAGVAS